MKVEINKETNKPVVIFDSLNEAKGLGEILSVASRSIKVDWAQNMVLSLALNLKRLELDKPELI